MCKYLLHHVITKIAAIAALLITMSASTGATVKGNLTVTVLMPGKNLSVVEGESTNFSPLLEDPGTSDAAVRLVLALNGNTARYLVREQLAGFNFPNDAVGETSDISGSIVFSAQGDLLPDESAIVVNITGLKSDRDGRDNYIQRNTLEGATYPTVIFVPLQTRGLAFPLPVGGTGNFDIVGNLTIREVTKPVSWRVTATFGEGSMTGTARTEFTFEEFGMEKPRVRSVLSVADAIRLEFDFNMNIENMVSG